MLLPLLPFRDGLNS
uniref:Uncharacterized protein n=1 Tax=Anguilla anguilla TaxID=7936 RepID=A0A0E9U1D6_ANGAN